LNKIYYNGINLWIIGVYIVRNILRKHISSHFQNIFVDTDICIKCNLCVINCQMNAIIIENDTFTFLEKCPTCFHCINECPVEAIKERHA